jgi:metabotropic glutamate receptor 2/3
MAISSGYKFTPCLLTIFLGSVFHDSSGQKYVHIPGEFMLGGLFPIHFPNGDKCGSDIDQDLGIHLLDAAIFAVQEVNGVLRDSGISLGLVAYDTCYNINPALQHSLELEEQSYYTHHGELANISCSPFLTRRIIGIIGPVTSKETQIVASLFDLFQMPQVKYMQLKVDIDYKNIYLTNAILIHLNESFKFT